MSEPTLQLVERVAELRQLVLDLNAAHTSRLDTLGRRITDGDRERRFLADKLRFERESRLILDSRLDDLFEELTTQLAMLYAQSQARQLLAERLDRLEGRLSRLELAE